MALCAKVFLVDGKIPKTDIQIQLSSYPKGIVPDYIIAKVHYSSNASDKVTLVLNEFGGRHVNVDVNICEFFEDSRDEFFGI